VEPFHLVFDDEIFEIVKKVSLLEVKTKSYVNRIIKQALGMDTSLHLDHINRNPFDYRRENLRAISAEDNMMNRLYRSEDKTFYGASIHYRHFREDESWQRYCRGDVNEEIEEFL
jgi:hypothetical protein